MLAGDYVHSHLVTGLTRGERIPESHMRTFSHITSDTKCGRYPHAIEGDHTTKRKPKWLPLYVGNYRSSILQDYLS